MHARLLGTLEYQWKNNVWWSISQKGNSINHFGARDDQIIRIRKFFEEIGLLRPVRLQRPLRSMRPERFLRPGKSLLRTSELSRFLNSIIWVLISLDFDVLKKEMFWQYHKISCCILASFLSEAVEASLCYFFDFFLMKLKWWICGNMLTTLKNVT